MTSSLSCLRNGSIWTPRDVLVKLEQLLHTDENAADRFLHGIVKRRFRHSAVADKGQACTHLHAAAVRRRIPPRGDDALVG